MFLVVDANRVFSALISKGRVFNVFSLNKSLKKFEFTAPEFLFREIGEHFAEIIEKSKLPSDELAKVFTFLKEEIEFVPFSEFDKFANEAEQISPDPDDVEYFALALAFNCAIWSDETAFKKQLRVKVFNTDEVITLLRSKLGTTM